MLDCNVLMLSVLSIKGTAVIKSRETGCMAYDSMWERESQW